MHPHGSVVSYSGLGMERFFRVHKKKGLIKSYKL